jgi:primosomal protein N''
MMQVFVSLQQSRAAGQNSAEPCIAMLENRHKRCLQAVVDWPETVAPMRRATG